MKRNNAKRVLALVLASAMLLQQGSVGIFAAETETVTEAQTEQMTEAKVEETQAPATEAPAPETKAEETQAPATEALAEETKAEETQAPATEATEAPTEETKTEETQTPTTEAPTGETKIEETQAPATEAPGEGTETEETQAPATEAPAETATEAPTEAVTEVPTEKETETESETEEAVVLDTVITQEVFQKTVEDTVQTMVKYTVKVANKAKTADAEDVSVKVLLAKALSYSKEDGETAELGVYEKLEDAVNADVFKDIRLDDAVKDAYTEGGVVLWKDQKIAAGEEKEFVFFAAVEDGVADTEALRNLWFVNDEEITGNGKIEWLNTDLLKVEKELPIEFIYDDGNMVVTATLSDGAILPEGAQFVVTEKTLSEEEAALIEESLGDEQTMTGYVAYDMHFEVDGKEVEPENGTVSVSVSYEKAQTLAPVNGGEEAVPEDGEVKMLHITDEQTVEDVTTDVDVKKNGKVREVGFTTEGFSTYVLMSSNEVMPIADDENVIFVEDVKIGTKEYSHLTKTEAYTIFNGLAKATASDVNYVVYVGETLNLSANVTEAGYELTVADNNEKISGNNAKSDSIGLLKASFKGVTPGFCKVELKNRKGEVIDTFRIEVKTPIYVDTLLGLRHKDMIHELLAPYVYNPETNPGMYLYNPKGEALYVKNTDSVENPNHAEGVWEGRNGRYVMSIGETITLLAPGSGTFSVDNTGCMNKGTENTDNNMAKATFTATKAGNVKITYGEEAFYVTVRSDDTNADHLDIEIADGGTYTVTVEETVYNEKGEPDGTRITETVYYAFVTGVNDCYVYSNTDKTTEIAHLEKGAYYRSKYDVTQGQFELTSAWKTDGSGNLVDKDGNPVDDSGKTKVDNREIARNQIKAVTFNLDFLLRPKKKTVTYKKNGISYGTPEVETFKADDTSNEFTVSGVSVDMNANDIREAANKCPDHTGLDFTLKADINEVVDLGIASVQPEVRKIFRSDLGTTLEEGKFTFDLYDKNPDTDKTANVLDTAMNNADGKVAFERIVYTAIGDHTYYIKERVPEEPKSGIIYDTRVVEMEVKVERATINGKASLKATYTYKYVGSESTFEYDPEFINAEPNPKKTEATPGDRHMVKVGDKITYEINWHNYKNQEATVVITDKLDPGVTYDSSTPKGKYDDKNHIVTWTLERQKANETGTIELTVIVNEKAFSKWTYKDNADEGTDGAENENDFEVLNRASVQVDNDAKVFTNTVENPLPKKTEETPGDRKMVSVGGQITYRIYWKNGYDEPKTVTITDKLDPGVDFVSATNGGAKSAEDDHLVVWTISAAAAGNPDAEGYVELTVVVTDRAYESWKYNDDSDILTQYGAANEKDYEVWNRAAVQVGNDPKVLTDIVENPVTEKKETTPGDRKLVNVGDEITYEIYWKNGQKEAADVVITDPLDDGVDFVSASEHGNYVAKDHQVTWTLSKQPAGAQGYVTLTVKVNEKAFGGWKYDEEKNEGAATAGEDYEVWNRAEVKVGNDSTFTNEVENPVTEKKETTPGDRKLVSVGDEITYEIYWKNGQKEAADVVITDPLDDGVDFVSASNSGSYAEKEHKVTWTLPEQPAGAQGFVTLKVKVNEKAFSGWKYDAEANKGATTTGEDYEVWNRAEVKIGNDATFTNEVENPLPEKTEVTPGKGVMTEVGKDITYEIHWKNGHKEPATVTITDKLDPGVTFKSADNGGTCKDGVVTWTLDAAAAGEAGSEGVVKLIVTVNENAYDTWQYGGGDKPVAGEGKDYEVLNRASVKVGHDPAVMTDIIPNPVPEKTEVTPGKGMMVGIGQEITYEIHWKNGHDEPATVTVTDKLDPGVTFKSADNGGTCKDGVVTWTLNAAAAGEAGSEGSVKLTVTVNENAYKTYTYGDGDTPKAGEGKDYEVLNRAGVQVDHDPVVLTNIIPNPVPEKEETDPGANETVYVGDQITYEIHWKNGHDTSADVTVTDPLDEGLDFVSADQGGTYDSATRTVTWVIRNVAAGQSGKVTLTTKVNLNARKDDHIVENQAGVQVGNDPKVLTQIIPNPTPEEPRNGKISVTKELTVLGEKVFAVDETFYVALFSDEACKKRVTEIKALEFKKASSSTVTFEDIDIGRTYYVGEVNSDGEVILNGKVKDGTLFAANFNKGKSVSVEKPDGSGTIVFENTFREIPPGFYREGVLNITKKLLGVDGEALESDETFYAGIFADEAHTTLSDKVTRNVVALALNGGSSVSESDSVVCEPGKKTTLYVTEVTSDGTPVGKSFGYTVTVDNGEVTLDESNMSADVTITNQEQEETESEFESESESESEAVKPTAKSVKTGDNTPITRYVLLALAAIALAMMAAAMRRRRRIEK